MTSASTPTVERSSADTPTVLRANATVSAPIRVNGSLSPVQRSNAVMQTVLQAVSTQGPRGPKGDTGGTDALVLSEIPTGVVDGSNATFATAFDFNPDKVSLRVNGLSQAKPDHFQTVGTKTIVFADSPDTGDLIQVDYVRA